jgi:hypothetical protein
MESLQRELLAIKVRWGTEVKFAKAAGASPWPIVVLKTIPRPLGLDAERFDVTEFTVKLCIAKPHPEASNVSVEIPSLLPPDLLKRMVTLITRQWHAALLQPNRIGWLLEPLLAWCALRFIQLIQLMPVCLEAYDGVSSSGITMRKFALVFPVEAKEEEVREETEEERIKREEAAAYWEQKALEKALEEEEAREREAVEKRREHELGLSLPKPKQLSKKDQDEAYEAKHHTQGQRLRKTGPKKVKFDPDAKAKAEKEREKAKLAAKV